MAATALVRDVLWRVAVLLQDTAPQFQRWPERELVHWLNDAQVAVVKFLPSAASRVDAIKLAAGTRQSIAAIPAANCKPGDGSTPSAPIYGTLFLNPRRNMGADGVSPGRSVRMVDRDVLDSQTPNWHTLTGADVSSVVFDPLTPRFFYVTPGVPVGQDRWLEIAYNAASTSIPNVAADGSEAYANSGSSTVTISIDDEHVDDLVNYVVARANMKDAKFADPAKAVAHTNLFLGSLNAKVTAMTGTNPNLRMLPGVDVAGRPAA